MTGPGKNTVCAVLPHNRDTSYAASMTRQIAAGRSAAFGISMISAPFFKREAELEAKVAELKGSL